MDLITVRLAGNYSEEWTDGNATLKFESGDVLTLPKEKYRKVIHNLKFNFCFSDIKEVIQKKATQTRVVFKSGDSITVNSKYGMRFFKFLNDNDFD
jgi:hypothetical protein